MISNYVISVLASLTVEGLMIWIVKKDEPSTVKFKRFIKHTVLITLFILLVQILSVFSNVTINNSSPTKTINLKMQNNSLNLTINNK